VNELVQVDLDGDGMPEVLFSGVVSSGKSSPRSVRSIVGVVSESGRLLLKAENRDHPSEPGVSIRGVTDVEGDGCLELVLYTRGDHWARYAFIGFAQSKVRGGYETGVTW